MLSPSDLDDLAAFFRVRGMPLHAGAGEVDFGAARILIELEICHELKALRQGLNRLIAATQDPPEAREFLPLARQRRRS